MRGSSCLRLWGVWLLSVVGGVLVDERGGLVLGGCGGGEEFEGAVLAGHRHGVAGSGGQVAQEVLVGAGGGAVIEFLGAGLAGGGGGAADGGDGFFRDGPPRSLLCNRHGTVSGTESYFPGKKHPNDHRGRCTRRTGRSTSTR